MSIAARIVALCAAGLLWAGPAAASPISIQLEWLIIEGEGGDEQPRAGGLPAGADATGLLVIDDSLLTGALDFFGTDPDDIPIIDFTLWINNGALAPAMFGRNDFSYVFRTLGPLDPTINFLDQANFDDFNFFSDEVETLDAPGGAQIGQGPQGVEQNTFEFGPDTFQLSSTSQVPLPAPLVLLIAGLGVFGWFSRRVRTP